MANKTDGDGFAFPSFTSGGEPLSEECEGLTKREYFACKLMAASVAADVRQHYGAEGQAEWAVAAAESLILALNGENK